MKSRMRKVKMYSIVYAKIKTILINYNTINIKSKQKYKNYIIYKQIS